MCTDDDDEEDLLPPSQKARRGSVEPEENNEARSVDITVPYQSRKRTFNVTSPWSKRNINRLARKNLTSLVSSLTDSSRTANLVLKRVALTIRNEMTSICSLKHNSILRDSND
jgi:hypothetical protein